MDRSYGSNLIGYFTTLDEILSDFNPERSQHQEIQDLGWIQPQQEHQVIIPPSASPPAAHQSQLDANPANTTTCCYEPPHGGRHVGDSDDDPLSRSRRSRRVNTLGNNGAKSCTCKKTKCLKQYCECFANKYYCSEACSCEGCYNTKEYEDLVQKSTKQIESCHQYAFSARATDPITSNSVRQRKGCNCKKSFCQKKYCECYQAGVGCSLNCRCENCRNSYGLRNEYNQFAEMPNESIRGEDDSTNGRQEGAITDVNHQENNTHLSSLTAALPSSMENIAPTFQPTGSHNPLPSSETETITPQSLQEKFIQDGTNNHTKHNVPGANLAHQFAKNTSLTEPLRASGAGSAESDARNSQSLQSDLTQVGGALSDPGAMSSMHQEPESANNRLSQ